MPRNFRNISAWQLADDLAVGIYRATEGFPSDERYGLTQQLRRAAVSVPSNIAEGAGRRTKADYLYFCSVAQGSLAEARYQLHLARRLGYVADDAYAELDNLANRVGAALHGLVSAMQNERL